MTNPVWKRWGAELRRQRKQAGHPQAAIANAMNVARTTLGAFERGTRTPSRDHAVAADKALSVGGALVHLWDEINDIREIPEDWRNFEKVETQAVEIREYHSTLIPGLLQSPEYARAILQNTDAWADEQIERLVTARTARLDNLNRAPLSFVVDEVVLRRGHGSWDILRAQLAHIRKLIAERRIRMQVLPQTTLSHPGPGGSFRIMTLRDGRIIGHEEYRSGVNVVTGPPGEPVGDRIRQPPGGSPLDPRLGRSHRRDPEGTMSMDTWRTSSYSGPENPNCVECRVDRGRVLVRDTLHRERGHLAFPAAEWRAFLAEVRRGAL